MNYIKILHIVQTCVYLVYIAFDPITQNVVLIAASVLLQVVLLYWRKYERIGLEFAHLLATLPMGFMLDNDILMIIIMVQQLSMNNNRIMIVRVSYIAITALVLNYQSLPMVIIVISLITLMALQYLRKEKKDLKRAVKNTNSVKLPQISSIAKLALQESNNYFQQTNNHHHSMTMQRTLPQMSYQFLQIIDEFPEGVALILFDVHRQPVVDFCNQSMQTILRTDDYNILQAISQLSNLTLMKQTQKQHQTQIDLRSSISTYLSSNQIDKQFPGNIRTQFRAQTFCKRRDNQEFRRERDSNRKEDIFSKVLEQAKYQIHRDEVQHFLKKARISFDLFAIFNGYSTFKGKQRCIEIKLFISFLNDQPQILLLSRDVQHRDYIKLLDQQSKAKSNTLNYVSHEFRTPLNCIIQLLENNTASNDDLKVALQNCYYLLNFSNDLMDLAQIKVGKFHLNKTLFNISQLIHSCFDLFRIQSLKKDIKLIYEAQDIVPKNVYNDEMRIKQVLINLIGNAFKYTLEGSIRVEVVKQPDSIQIKVVDTGVGIREEDKVKLLKAFGRIDNETSKTLNRNGVGLGLLISNVICYSLSHKGAPIQICSQVFRGSTFSFDIDYEVDEVSVHLEDPIQEQLEQDEQSEKSDRSDRSCKSQQSILSFPEIQKVYSSYDKYRDVLIIDDNQFILNVTRQQLTNKGVLNIDIALNCEHALLVLTEALNNGINYKVILLDIEMPLVDGFDTLKRIQTLYDCRGIKLPTVLGCSGYSALQTKPHAIQAGMADYFEKPLKEREIEIIINNYI